MHLAPEGVDVIALSAIIVVLMVVLSFYVKEGRLLWLPALAVVWFFIVVQFFRDPERFPPEGERLILSPADGKIISIGEAIDSPLEPPGQRISIFMSPLNVHINRSPTKGIVKSVEAKPGKFISAFKPEASRVNEQVLTIIDTPFGVVAFKQIAGYFARRIITHLKPGDNLTSGQRIGMIKFGSRVDLFIPDNVEIKVRLGQIVTAGETVIGEFKNES